MSVCFIASCLPKGLQKIHPQRRKTFTIKQTRHMYIYGTSGTVIKQSEIAFQQRGQYLCLCRQFAEAVNCDWTFLILFNYHLWLRRQFEKWRRFSTNLCEDGNQRNLITRNTWELLKALTFLYPCMQPSDSKNSTTLRLLRRFLNCLVLDHAPPRRR